MAFTTLKGLFELTVIFFGLTNFLEIFHTMMNKILQNLINTEIVRSFIDNIIVETEEKEHNEIVKKSSKEVGRE